MAAASIFRNIVRNKNLYVTKLIARPPLPPPNLLLQIPQATVLIDEIPFYGHRKIDDLKMNPSVSSYFYPSFSFESLLHPVSSPIGLIQSETDEETLPVSEINRTIWADSVKKKRKKKMNKHKLRKLRKSLKNKT